MVCCGGVLWCGVVCGDVEWVKVGWGGIRGTFEPSSGINPLNEPRLHEFPEADAEPE